MTITHRGHNVSLAMPAEDFADEAYLVLMDHFRDFWFYIAPKERAALERAEGAARAALRAGDAPGRYDHPFERMTEASTALHGDAFDQAVAIGVALAGLHRALTGRGRVCPRCEGMGCTSGDLRDCLDCGGGGVVGGTGLPPDPPTKRPQPDEPSGLAAD